MLNILLGYAWIVVLAKAWIDTPCCAEKMTVELGGFLISLGTLVCTYVCTYTYTHTSNGDNLGYGTLSARGLDIVCNTYCALMLHSIGFNFAAMHRMVCYYRTASI
jgi:hypothetical protein